MNHIVTVEKHTISTLYFQNNNRISWLKATCCCTWALIKKIKSFQEFACKEEVFMKKSSFSYLFFFFTNNKLIFNQIINYAPR